jgi:hypothetical protein
MFTSLFDLAANLTKIVVAPIEVVAGVANTVLEPVVEATEEIVKDIKSIND